MRKIWLTKNRCVYNFSKPYVIAEIGANHNGEISLAKKLILAAKEAQADCVKFQSWTKDSIFAKKVYKDNYFLADDYRNRKDFTLEEIVAKFSFSEKKLWEMKKYAEKLSIDCISTPFSNKEVDFLCDTMKAPFIKIASMDLNNYPFLEYVAKKKKPIVLSIGLSELYEIDKAIRVIENAGNSSIVILHCIANYPPRYSEINLNNIETLQKLYPYPIGFSDHTFGWSIPLAAVAKGACIIEKHFTLDKSMFGWDHKISANPEELKIICAESEKVWESLGEFRIACEENTLKKEAFRRSIVSASKLKKGQVLSRKDIDFKRPGTGIAPGELAYVVGRVAKRDIPQDAIVSWKDLV